MDIGGGASHTKGNRTVDNILSQFLFFSHDDNEDGSPGERYETNLGELSAEVVCTLDFWGELAHYVVFTYALGRPLKPER